LQNSTSDNKPDHDYGMLDQRFPATYRTDRIIQAKELGFDYISEATIKLYRKYKSQKIVAVILGMTANGIGSRLRRYKEPCRGPGSLPGRMHEYKNNQK